MEICKLGYCFASLHRFTKCKLIKENQSLMGLIFWEIKLHCSICESKGFGEQLIAFVKTHITNLHVF